MQQDALPIGAVDDLTVKKCALGDATMRATAAGSGVSGNGAMVIAQGRLDRAALGAAQVQSAEPSASCY
jgi:hypothetical protein